MSRSTSDVEFDPNGSLVGDRGWAADGCVSFLKTTLAPPPRLAIGRFERTLLIDSIFLWLFSEDVIVVIESSMSTSSVSGPSHPVAPCKDLAT